MKRKPVTGRRDKEKEISYAVEETDTLLPFLLTHVKGKSRNNLKSLLARRLVAVDGKPEHRFDHPLAPGQSVTLLSVSAPERDTLPFEILFENEELLVINKPAGLLSIANEKEKTRTAYHMVTDYVKNQNMDNRVFIVHRLDKETSGVLIFARNEELKRAFQEGWNERIIRRGYTAVVEGVPEEEKGTVRSYLIETATHLVFSGDPGPNAKEAITHYRTLKTGGGFAMLDVEIDTGRKNQIRVHMKDLEHPIAGDKRYDAETNPLGRLCLHAGELILRHPLTGEELTFRARTPKEFHRLFR